MPNHDKSAGATERLQKLTDSDEPSERRLEYKGYRFCAYCGERIAVATVADLWLGETTDMLVTLHWASDHETGVPFGLDFQTDTLLWEHNCEGSDES